MAPRHSEVSNVVVGKGSCELHSVGWETRLVTGQLDQQYRHIDSGRGPPQARPALQAGPGRQPRLRGHQSAESHHPIVRQIGPTTEERPVGPIVRVESRVDAAQISIGSVHGEHAGRECGASIVWFTARGITFLRGLTVLQYLSCPFVDSPHWRGLRRPVALDEFRRVTGELRWLGETVRGIVWVKLGFWESYTDPLMVFTNRVNSPTEIGRPTLVMSPSPVTTTVPALRIAAKACATCSPVVIQRSPPRCRHPDRWSRCGRTGWLRRCRRR